MAETVNQPTWAPTRKVSAAGIGAVVSLVLIWILQTALPDLVIPEAIAAAIGSIISFALAYLVPEWGTADEADSSG